MRRRMLNGHWFHAESLERETRWPSFTPRARGLGIKAIRSSPLKALEQPIGALNIYSRTAETFEIKDQEAAALFAHKASVILSDAQAGVSDSQLALRYQEALHSRMVISLATGVIMEREGMCAKPDCRGGNDDRARDRGRGRRLSSAGAPP